MGRELGGGSGLETHVHPWQIHVNVWQNQYNIIKQNKVKIKIKKKIVVSNGLRLPHGMWNLPGLGFEPVVPCTGK